MNAPFLVLRQKVLAYGSALVQCLQPYSTTWTQNYSFRIGITQLSRTTPGPFLAAQST